MWQEYQIEERVMQILKDVPDAIEGHHFGRPYLTAYQLAIEFAKRYPEAFAAIGKPLGGAGIGEPTSLAQYLAGGLSRNIKSGKITHIEGGFLTSQNLKDIFFRFGGETVRSSMTGSSYPLSMFRLK